MKLNDILNSYQIESLEQLATGKIQDIDHIKLPREVLVDELSNHLLKFYYIQKSLSLRNPPSYLILSKIIDEPDHKISVKGFKDAIKKNTEIFIKSATKGEGLRSKKDYSLYLKMLQVAWESDSSIDLSEYRLLMALRDELDISFKEHIILEHHESLTTYWFSENYYERERNHLIASGILHPLEGYFTIASEMIPIIRKTWGFSLTNEQYQRLLEQIPSHDLTEILKKNELSISGSAAEKSIRIIENYVSPRNALNNLSNDILRDAARKIGSQISGSKSDIIENIIDFIDSDEDLRRKEELEKKLAPPKPEEKVLGKEAFHQIFTPLSNEQLYSIASGLRKINKSGSKMNRIQSIWDSIYSENTLLNQLSSSELYDLCSKLNVKVSGSKQDKISRIVDNFSSYSPPEESDEIENDTASIISLSTQVDREKAKEKRSESIDGLKVKYPYLSSDELIILSFIIENKTASGPVIERLVARFDLPWYFPETQMNDMIKKMQENGQDIIVVQKYSDHPLYQLK
ncbi:MAG: hypothetical protein ABUK01_09685 [Leptospirales bacterium]